MSSMFERWRERIIPSATTAESSDSIAPSKAIVIAGENTPIIFSQVMCGKVGAGNVFGTAPNLLCIVSTLISNS